MMPVDTYVSVNPKDIISSVNNKNFLPFQGSNILFMYGDYADTPLLSFLEIIFDMVGKVAFEGKDSNYYILSNKFGDDFISPFTQYEDISEKLHNDVQKISSYILLSFVNKYEV